MPGSKSTLTQTQLQTFFSFLSIWGNNRKSQTTHPTPNTEINKKNTPNFFNTASLLNPHHVFAVPEPLSHESSTDKVGDESDTNPHVTAVNPCQIRVRHESMGSDVVSVHPKVHTSIPPKYIESISFKDYLNHQPTWTLPFKDTVWILSSIPKSH